MKKYLYLSYTEREYPGTPHDPRDEWTSYSDGHIEFELLSAHLDGNNARWSRQREEIDFDVKVGEPVYVVVARYTDGGTFGCTHGYWSIEGIAKTFEEAKGIKDSIQGKRPNDFNWSDFKPWWGYFAYLDDEYIVTLEVQ